ncbi:unnamed protein product, partial [Staurois parvus]
MSLLRRGRQIPIRVGWTDDRSRSERDGWVTARSERGQTSRVGIVRAAWYRGSKRRMVGVTSQDQQVAGSVVQRVRQEDGQGRAGVRAGEGQH